MQTVGLCGLVALPRCASNIGYCVPRSRAGVSARGTGLGAQGVSRSRSTAGFSTHGALYSNSASSASLVCFPYSLRSTLSGALSGTQFTPQTQPFYSTLHGTPRTHVDSKLVSNNRYFSLHMRGLARASRRGSKNAFVGEPERTHSRHPSSQNSEHDTASADASDATDLASTPVFCRSGGSRRDRGT